MRTSLYPASLCWEEEAPGYKCSSGRWQIACLMVHKQVCGVLHGSNKARKRILAVVVLLVWTLRETLMTTKFLPLNAARSGNLMEHRPQTVCQFR